MESALKLLGSTRLRKVTRRKPDDTMTDAATPFQETAIALLILAPNLVWQVLNSFPSLAYVTNHGGTVALGGGARTYVIEFAVLLLALLLPLWLAAMISLLRSPLLRPIGICCLVPIVIFLPIGKSYYAAATIPIVMAQGLM
jgi:hypothetical protein